MFLSKKHGSRSSPVRCAVALLVVPALANANPGAGPDLVQRSGRLVVLHADRLDGTSTRQWMLVNGAEQVRVRAPADVWIEPGTPVQLQGTMRGGELVLADSLSAVKPEGPAPLAADAPWATCRGAVSREHGGDLDRLLRRRAGSHAVGPDDRAGHEPDVRSREGRFALTRTTRQQTYGQLSFGNRRASTR